MAARIFSAVLGLWLMVAPALLRYGGVAADNARIVGPIVFAVSVTACWEIARALRFAILPLAVWCMTASLFLGYTSVAATANDTVVGLALFGLAFVGGRIRRSYGGGWRALFST
jgi:hypothetical protein